MSQPHSQQIICATVTVAGPWHYLCFWVRLLLFGRPFHSEMLYISLVVRSGFFLRLLLKSRLKSTNAVWGILKGPQPGAFDPQADLPFV